MMVKTVEADGPDLCPDVYGHDVVSACAAMVVVS